jgi:L-malate glycosyltransferase
LAYCFYHMKSTMTSENYILWLVSWYPSRVDPFNGDFIERQAKAASLYQRIVVLYVVEDIYSANKSITIEKNISSNLTAYIGYLPAKVSDSNSKRTKRLINLYRYFKTTRTVLKKVRKENGKPALIHLHVTLWAGITALYLKVFKSRQYILTEHWTYFLPGAANNFYQKSRMEQFFVKNVLKNASLVLAVSGYLEEQLKKIAGSASIQTISNVVDTSLFYYSPETGRNGHTFVHVSAMSEQKQPEKIIRAFASVSGEIKDWKLVMIGPAGKSLIEIAEGYKLLNNQILFTGELPYAEVAEQTRMADGAILFSSYETQGCVILEALCCGVPVIAPDRPPMTEMININNGILVSRGNEEELSNAIIYLANNIQRFDRQKIAATAQEKYNYEKIGGQLNNVYQNFLDY